MMEVTLRIPDEIVRDYTKDKFKDFFSRVKIDMDGEGICGLYEKEIAEALLKAFDESEVRTEPTTNADSIRNMSDEDLADWISNMTNYLGEDGELYKSIHDSNKNTEEIIHDRFEDILEWLQSDVDEDASGVKYTNLDRIRRMDLEELAEFLSDLADCNNCDIECGKRSGHPTMSRCFQSWFRWLGEDENIKGGK